MSNTASFKAFLEGWEAKQRELLNELSVARVRDGFLEEEKMRELITRALSQFDEYYEEKSRAAHRDAFQMFSPEWCSKLECASYWISGFRPTAMLRLVETAADDLSSNQLLLLDRMKSETRWEERVISDEQARIQETIAGPPIAGAIKRVGLQPHNIKDGGQQSEEAMKTLHREMEALVTHADNLRIRTAVGAIEILTMKQSLSFLQEAIRLQQSMKIWGMERRGGDLGGNDGLLKLYTTTTTYLSVSNACHQNIEILKLALVMCPEQKYMVFDK